MVTSYRRKPVSSHQLELDAGVHRHDDTRRVDANFAFQEFTIMYHLFAPALCDDRVVWPLGNDLKFLLLF
jgi:hypothetical protein